MLKKLLLFSKWQAERASGNQNNVTHRQEIEIQRQEIGKKLLSQEWNADRKQASTIG